MGQLDRLRTELPESAEPLVPKHWGELNTVTIAFGHGLSVAPLQAVMGDRGAGQRRAAHPADLPQAQPRRGAQGRQARDQAGDQRGDALPDAAQRREGHRARSADVPGYYVGGKTGTAEKVVNGRYAKHKLLTDFMAILPADKPQYLLLIMLDEPQAHAGDPRLCHRRLERGADRRPR